MQNAACLFYKLKKLFFFITSNIIAPQDAHKRLVLQVYHW